MSGQRPVKSLNVDRIVKFAKTHRLEFPDDVFAAYEQPPVERKIQARDVSHGSMRKRRSVPPRLRHQVLAGGAIVALLVVSYFALTTRSSAPRDYGSYLADNLRVPAENELVLLTQEHEETAVEASRPSEPQLREAVEVVVKAPVVETPKDRPTLEAPSLAKTVVASVTIRQGDTLSKLSKQYYGRVTERGINAIFRANAGKLKSVDRLAVGANLVIPALNENARHARTLGPSAATKYRVRKGDTLIGIARKELGNGRRYREIQGVNRDTLRNSSMIFPGMELRLPTH